MSKKGRKRQKNARVHVIRVLLRWTQLVWRIEQILNAEKDLRHGNARLPIVAENREADGAARKDVWVEEALGEFACK